MMNIKRSDSVPWTGAMRVLLVEDDSLSSKYVADALASSRAGRFDVTQVVDLAGAAEAVQRQATDVILLDLGLPDSDGIDTLRKMLAAAGTIPVIVLTGLDDGDLATLAVQRGAQDFLVKGRYDNYVLERAVLHAVERARATRALTEEHALLQTVIDTIPDPVYIKDLDGRFTAANSAAAAFYGFRSADALLDRHELGFHSREQALRHAQEERTFLESGKSTVNTEEMITDAGGHSRWVLSSKVILRDAGGRTTGLLGIDRDISEQKRDGEAIRALNTQLEQRVMERTAELSRTLERLERSNRLRMDFVSNVSHELKTPLTSMGFAVTNLMDGVAGPVSEPVRESLKNVLVSCRRIANTVNDVLDLSRLETRSMRLDRAHILLEGVVRQCIKTLRDQARSRHVTLVYSSGMGLGTIHADEPKVLRALVNVVSNAIKFTPGGGTVEIVSRREDGNPGNTVLEITDTGIGIPSCDVKRVTEKFYRVGEHIKGTGLGLTITKEIIELHGGRLLIESPPPGKTRGTRVTVMLPADTPQKVLVANADEGLRNALQQRMAAYGYDVVVCAGTLDVLEAIHRHQPRIVVVDAVATEPDGEELPLRIKADAGLSDVPLLAVMGRTMGFARQEVYHQLGIPLLQRDLKEDDLLSGISRAVRGMSAGDGWSPL